MDRLYMLQTLADIQVKSGGVVRTRDVLWQCRRSRSTVNRWINILIKTNYVIKVKRGQYALKSDDKLLAIGLSVVTPMDVFEYRSKLALEGQI